jgi:hypothetical protein
MLGVLRAPAGSAVGCSRSSVTSHAVGMAVRDPDRANCRRTSEDADWKRPNRPRPRHLQRQRAARTPSGRSPVEALHVHADALRSERHHARCHISRPYSRANAFPHHRRSLRAWLTPERAVSRHHRRQWANHPRRARLNAVRSPLLTALSCGRHRAGSRTAPVRRSGTQTRETANLSHSPS